MPLLRGVCTRGTSAIKPSILIHIIAAFAQAFSLFQSSKLRGIRIKPEKQVNLAEKGLLVWNWHLTC